MVDVPDPIMVAYEQAVQAGEPGPIAEALQALLTPRTVFSDAVLNQLFNQALRLKQHRLVLEIGQRLIQAQAQNTALLVNCGQSAFDIQKLDLAVMYFQQGLSQSTNDAERSTFHSLLARTCKDHAQMYRALLHFREGYRAKPDTDTASNLIMGLQYSADVPLANFYAQTKEYSQLFSGPRVQHDPARLDPGRAKLTRIGFVSGDFVSHSLSALLIDIFTQFRQVSAHEIYLYQTRPEAQSDDMTKLYQKSATVFRFVDQLAADQLTQQIVDDQIDILVDLSGHTAAGRMNVFLRKPAPVQVGWVCGMMSPCGLETVPYFLADKHMVTPEIRATCPEQLIELSSAYGYNPLIDIPLNVQLPVDRTGVFTFGCMNNPCKLHPLVIEAWSKILKALPSSQLRIKVMSADSALHLRLQFERLGVPAHRLGWVTPTTSNHDIMRFYGNNIDLALDPWPCTGMLTTLEAWWSGVPTITLAGDTFLHRQSTSVFTQLELPELIATSLDDYVAKAVALATNVDRLRDFRRTCRARLEMTIIRRPDELARGVLTGLEQAWTHWCTTRQPLRALRSAVLA